MAFLLRSVLPRACQGSGGLAAIAGQSLSCSCFCLLSYPPPVSVLVFTLSCLRLVCAYDFCLLLSWFVLSWYLSSLLSLACLRATTEARRASILSCADHPDLFFRLGLGLGLGLRFGLGLWLGPCCLALSCLLPCLALFCPVSY
jgi:hypothetical protein